MKASIEYVERSGRAYWRVVSNTSTRIFLVDVQTTARAALREATTYANQVLSFAYAAQFAGK